MISSSGAGDLVVVRFCFSALGRLSACADNHTRACGRRRARRDITGEFRDRYFINVCS